MALPAPESAQPFDPFFWALDFVLRWEGGYVDVCSLEDTRAIYRARYWDAVNGDGLGRISPRIALVCFDAAVQSGPGVAARTLQRVVRATPDGVVGPVTLARTRLRRQAAGEQLVLEAYMDRRRGFYAAIALRDATQRKFVAGWRNRRNALRQLIGLDPEEP